MITGHQHSTIAHLQDRLIDKDVVAMANKVGAKGFRLVGCTCVGQDLQLRGKHYEEVFSGHGGNNFTSEAIISTGAVDAIVSEFNCTLPGIEPITEKLNVKMICLDDVAKKANAEYVEYSYKDREKISEYIISNALDAYKERRQTVKINIPKNHGCDDVITGVSENSLKEFLGGTWKPLLNLIAEGKIKGVAGVVGCSNLTAMGHDVFTVELTKELIKRDIIVLSAAKTLRSLDKDSEIVMISKDDKVYSRCLLHHFIGGSRDIIDKNGVYKKIVHKDGIIYGAILQGDISYSGVLTELIKNKINISKIKKDIFDINFADFYNIKENGEFSYHK